MNTLSEWDRDVQVTLIQSLQWTTLLHSTLLQVPEMYVYCVTCPRSGPNWTDLRELLGQWEDPPMLLAASIMERSIPRCWSLVEWIRMTTLCRMHGSWMSTLGGGGRWVVMNVWLVQLTESVVQIKSMPISLVYATLKALIVTNKSSWCTPWASCYHVLHIRRWR